MQLITIDDVGKMTKYTTRHVRNLWYAGLFPKPIRLGRRSIRWRLEEVEQYIRSQRGESRPEKKEKEFA